MKLQESLEEWEEFEVTEVRKFAAWWNSMNAIDSENFPLSLDAGEFDEQYRMWESDDT